MEAYTVSSSFGMLITNGPNFMRRGSDFRVSGRFIKQFPSISLSLANRRVGSERRENEISVRASLSSGSGKTSDPIGPLQLESPVGQFLSQIMISHPHLVPAAVDQQLDQLQANRSAEKHDDLTCSRTELVLYRRIAEIKAKEMRKTLEEILYALVVKKFMDADIPLVPKITTSFIHVDTWPTQSKKPRQIHSPEACEMIQTHLEVILGNQSNNLTSFVQISKIMVEQVYGASIMYGYFLKRVDQRFQLEKTVKMLPKSSDKYDEEQDIQPQKNKSLFETSQSHQEAKSSRLRAYIMSFDVEAIQRYAKIRSLEAITMIENHVRALFGKPNNSSTGGDLIKLSFGGLKTLVLEAVTFGSFLWEVESYVDSRYHFVRS